MLDLLGGIERLLAALTVDWFWFVLLAGHSFYLLWAHTFVLEPGLLKRRLSVQTLSCSETVVAFIKWPKVEPVFYPMFSH